MAGLMKGTIHETEKRKHRKDPKIDEQFTCQTVPGKHGKARALSPPYD